MTKRETISRRKVLASSVAVSTVSLSGCGGDAPTGSRNTGKWIPVKNSELKPYMTESVTGSRGPVNYTANILLYEDIQMKQKLRSLTLGQFSSESRILGSIYIQFSGFGSGIASQLQNKIESQIDSELKNTLSDFGVMNLSEIEDTEYSREYEGEIEIGTITVPSQNLPEGTEEISFEPDPVTVSVGFDLLQRKDSNIPGIIWIEPKKEYSQSVPDISLTGTESDGLNISPYFELTFEEYKSLSLVELEQQISQNKPIDDPPSIGN